MTDLVDLNGFAIDLGGTKTAAARINHGVIVDRKTLPTVGHASPDRQVGVLGELLNSVGYQRGDRLGAAITGRIDNSGAWHAVNHATLASIRAVPIAENIVQTIGPVAVINDAAAATLAEAKYGSGICCENFGYVTVSTGVGGGLYLGGRLHQSTNGVAGHIGFNASSFGSEMCGSGRFGTVESVASGNAIARSANDLGHPDLDARGVFECAANGESWAMDLVDNSAAAIAELCANLTTTLGLDSIAIGGSIGMADGYLDRVQAHAGRLPEIFQTRLAPAALGHDGPLIGALLTAQAEY